MKEKSISIRRPKPKESEVRAQLQRMLNHDAFVRSDRLQRFLTFVVDSALEGSLEDLKEYTVALNVFDKDDSFDPRIDPIVRVEASRLRRRIEEYYQTSPSDPVLIRLRKRGYRPIIRWMKRSDLAGGNQAARISVRGGEPVPSSIVVLPFRDLSVDQSQEYFCEAITQQLATILPTRNHIRTVAHTSAMKFADEAFDVRRVGGELRVDLILEGSVQRSGGRIRVTAKVCRTTDGLQIWSDTFDRELDDVLVLQDDLSEAIASNLRTAVEAEKRAQHPRREGIPSTTKDHETGHEVQSDTLLQKRDP